jgi:thymidylate kinase
MEIDTAMGAPGGEPPISSLLVRLDRLDCQVLIVGSLPPGGRDYDLMVRPTCRLRVVEALEADGFQPFQGQWFRLSSGRIDLVDVITTDDWGLSEQAAIGLFDASRPLAGFQPLQVPSPAHQLLVLARKLAQRDGRFSPKHLRRVESVLERDPGAWDAACSLAEEWGAVEALRRLERRRELSLLSWARAEVGRRTHGAIVALSGLDGAGKSTQAHLLERSIAGLGRDVKVVWAPFGRAPALARLALIMKKCLARLPFGPLATADPAAVTRPLFKTPRDIATPQSRLRQAAICAYWLAVAVADGLSRRRAAFGSRTAARVVIFDRYVLDAVVDLRTSTAPFAGRSLVERVLCSMSPRPTVAIFLAVPPEVAHARAPDWGLGETRARADLYGSEHRRLGVIVCDATGALEQTAERIAREVVSAIS